MNSNQLVLPFAEREYVDVARCAHILGVSWTTVHRLAATIDFHGKPLISMIEYRRGARKRILYSSIVYFCDHLRQKYSIADRRPKLTNPLLRNRDEDLLPFPLADTIYTEEAMNALGYQSKRPLLDLIEEGRFEAYCLIPGNTWRISRSSFAAYLEVVRNRPSETKPPYKRVAGPRIFEPAQ